MREPPTDLSAHMLRTVLATRYALRVANIRFLPLGHDALAWVYEVRTAGAERYFLKARRGAVHEPSLLVPHFLHDQGIDAVIAPLPAEIGELCVQANAYTLVLYPFVEGNPGNDADMTPQQWIDYGRIVRRFHDLAVPSDLAQRLPRETFVPSGVALLQAVEPALDLIAPEDDAARTVAAFWQERHAEIHTLAARAEALGKQLAARRPPLALCHADVHTANLLIDTAAQVRIVDWDEAMLAPVERDLMFVLGGGISDAWVQPEDEAHFLQGYGRVEPDPLALAYYRYAWAVSDIGAYATQVFLRPDLGPTDRRESAQIFVGLFKAGEIVAKALASPLQ